MQQGGTPVSVSGPQVLQLCRGAGCDSFSSSSCFSSAFAVFTVLFATACRIFHDPIGRCDASSWTRQESCEQGWPCSLHVARAFTEQRGSCEVAGQKVRKTRKRRSPTSPPPTVTLAANSQRNRTAQRKCKKRVLFFMVIIPQVGNLASHHFLSKHISKVSAARGLLI